jgi:SAM-dependent methyltransferase
VKLDNKEMLKCTNCGSEILISAQKMSGLICSACKFEFPIDHNVFFMISKNREHDTLKKFEHQWKTWGDSDVIFGKTVEQYEDRFLTEFCNPKWTREWFRGKKALDAGCGHGIMVEVFQRLGADSFGLELGNGVFKAAKRLNDLDVTLVQGDILDVPFKKNSFDYVYSNGVIHHTGDTRKAFNTLAALVKPGGGMDLWLYPKKDFFWESIMYVGRGVTTRIHPAILSKLVYLLVPLLYIVPTWSRTHPRTHSIKQCAQVIYDWLSPKHQTHHTFEEVKQWYIEEGFVDITQNTITPLSIFGVKSWVR